MYPNAEADPAIWRESCIGFGQGRLRIHRALHRVNRAPKLGKNTVARRVGYTTPMFPNEPVEDRPPLREPLERADLIGAHETTVAFHIRCEDCHQLPADIRKVGHECLSATCEPSLGLGARLRQPERAWFSEGPGLRWRAGYT